MKHLLFILLALSFTLAHSQSCRNTSTPKWDEIKIEANNPVVNNCETPHWPFSTTVIGRGKNTDGVEVARLISLKGNVGGSNCFGLADTVKMVFYDNTYISLFEKEYISDKFFGVIHLDSYLSELLGTKRLKKIVVIRRDKDPEKRVIYEFHYSLSNAGCIYSFIRGL